MTTRKISLGQLVISSAQALLGVTLTAICFGWIIVPQGFAAGGVTGFARSVQRLVPLPLPVLVLAFNVGLLVLGLLFVGRAFAARTVVISLLFPTLLDLFSAMPVRVAAREPLLAVLEASILLGVGAGLIIRSGASSGGFDTLAVVLNRHRGISVALVMNACDCVGVALQAMGQPLDKTFYGVMVILLSNYIIERVANYRGPARVKAGANA